MSDLNVSTPEVSTPTLNISISSLADSGNGSLRGALELISTMNITDGNITLVFDDSLAGGTLELLSALPMLSGSSAITISAPEGGITITGYGLQTETELTLNNITLPELEANAAHVNLDNVTVGLLYLYGQNAGYTAADNVEIGNVVSDVIRLKGEGEYHVQTPWTGNQDLVVESGVWSFDTPQQYIGSTTVCEGATLILNVRTNERGVIKGTVNVLGTLELGAADCTGYADQANSIQVINLGNAEQGGAVLHVAVDSANDGLNQTLGGTIINMYGSSITGVDGANIDLFNYNGRIQSAGINVYAVEGGASQSVINLSTMNLRQPSTTIMVDAGAELVINSLLGNGYASSGHNLLKTGSGKLVLTNGGNAYSGGTEVSGGELLVQGGALGAGPVVVNSGASLTFNSSILKSDSQTVTIKGGGRLEVTDSVLMPSIIVVQSGSHVVLTNTVLRGLVVEAGAIVELTDCRLLGEVSLSVGAAFSLGIGQLFLGPYKETAIAAFYREVSETWDEPAAVVLEDASKQRNGVVAVLLIFGLIATTAVLFKVGLSNVKDTKEDTVVTEQRIHGNLYRVSKSINKELFSDELWNSVTKIEYFEGSEYPYVVRSKETLQEIGDLIKNLEHKKVEKPLLEGGWIFDIYTEDAMSDVWISNNIIDFNGRCYQVPTEGLGDQIRELVLNNFEMQLRVDEYVTNDYRIKLLDKPKGYDELIDLEIQFLTDKDGHILQNTVKVEHLGEATGFDVKLSDSTGRTKSVQVTSDRYKLTFNFDIETCEVFDDRKIVNY